ncbi:C39 family peptidase [Dyella psychrodurans]|uniref:Peptidase C39 n=1 Tax=Dyella psychrodurans TaxID=1927960 RepID=A0A370WW37_9GAMM|nr:C39 family peptidase [Dyella psychrodurans]RDS80276.1 peptidase C39 [Dyella psychrodurans]
MRRLLPTLAFVALCIALPTSVRAGTMALNDNAGQTYTLHILTLKEVKFRNTIHQKYDFSCGSAAVATLLTYQYDYPVNEQVVFEQMYAHGDRNKINKEGFSLLDIKLYLESIGFDADGFRASLDQLQKANLPAIVLIQDRGYHHFVVIKGIRYGRVLVGDPARGTRAIPLDRFNQLWTNGLVFVIHNRRQFAHFNTDGDWHNAPIAPLGIGIDRRGLDTITMSKYGPGDI